MGKATWYRRPWVGPLGFLVVAFVAFSLPPYLTFDPALSRVPVPERHAWYYPALAVHVVFGSVAILTCVFQVWPAFRRRYPAWHRRLGRTYVFAGVLPAGVLALAIGAVTPFGPVNRVGNVLQAVLWLAFTVAAVRMARQRRVADHRRWALRSFALTVAIISNRFWAVLFSLTLPAELDTAFGGSEVALAQAISGLSGWLGMLVPLLAVEWWLERDRARGRGRGPRAKPEPKPEPEVVAG
ncbi:DUF2306 domain-containing protein [Saccharothrix sp. Mg75]|uniref:DUF2306 domain-containing protein n=1 Tax=Saccharothrix sp. Mg75 TaxID=3445357 RepID=UPI003EEC2867